MTRSFVRYDSEKGQFCLGRLLHCGFHRQQCADGNDNALSSPGHLGANRGGEECQVSPVEGGGGAGCVS